MSFWRDDDLAARRHAGDSRRSAPWRGCAGCARPAAVDHAVLRDDAGEVQLGHRLDDARAADAGDASGRSPRRSRLVRPQLAADHLEARLSVVAVDPHPLDRAGRRALAVGDLRALEGRAGRRGAGEQPLAVAQHDLGVGADIDQQHDLLLSRAPRTARRRRCRRRRGRRCRAGYRRGRRVQLQLQLAALDCRSARRSPARRAHRPARSDRCRAGCGA